VRIRHYGFLANRASREKLALCRALLAAETTTEPVMAGPTPEPIVAAEDVPDGTVCPICGRGRLVTIEMLRPAPIGQGEQGGLVPREAGHVEAAAD
jgi:hypothetical protein